MLNAHGIDCSGKTARQMTSRDYEYYDYVVLMDWTGSPRDVADLWYTGDFDATWRDVNEGCSALLKHIIERSLRSGYTP